MNEHTKPIQTQRILARLRAEHEVTNVQLNQMGIYRYGARILELRNAGHNIVSIKHKGGLWSFRLDEPQRQAVQVEQPETKQEQVQLFAEQNRQTLGSFFGGI